MGGGLGSPPDVTITLGRCLTGNPTTWKLYERAFRAREIMQKTGVVLLLITGLGLSITTAQGPAQAQAPAGPAVNKIDPSLDAIIASDAKLEILKEEYFAFTEGPVWFPEAGGGYLLFSDLPANKIYKWDPKGGLSVFLDPSGFTGKEFPDTGAFSKDDFTFI